MFTYVCLGTNDLKRAARFYDATLGTLGLSRCDVTDESEWDGWIGWGTYAEQGRKEIALWLCQPFNGQPATAGNGTMVALRASTWQQVQAFHAAALSHGGQSEGEPGLRTQYNADFYAAYVRDPDGNKIAAVCRGFTEPQWKLRPGTINDAEAIAELLASFQYEITDRPDGAGAEQYLEAVSSQAERGYLSSPRYSYIVAEDERTMLGFIAVRDGSHLFHLFVAREHQGQGIAGRLWQEAKSQAMKAAAPSQFTVNSSRLGVPVYRAFGFKAVGEEVSQHGVTVVQMRLEM